MCFFGDGRGGLSNEASSQANRLLPACRRPRPSCVPFGSAAVAVVDQPLSPPSLPPCAASRVVSASGVFALPAASRVFAVVQSSHVRSRPRLWNVGEEKKTPANEAAGEAIYAALFDSAPTLQGLFKNPRAVMAMRFMGGLNQIISSLRDPKALKARVRLGGQGSVKVCAPRWRLAAPRAARAIDSTTGDRRRSACGEDDDDDDGTSKVTTKDDRRQEGTAPEGRSPRLRREGRREGTQPFGDAGRRLPSTARPPPNAREGGCELPGNPVEFVRDGAWLDALSQSAGNSRAVVHGNCVPQRGRLLIRGRLRALSQGFGVVCCAFDLPPDGVVRSIGGARQSGQMRLSFLFESISAVFVFGPWLGLDVLASG